MTIDPPTSRWFRRRDETARATAFELFFDLVFVFALTQITAYLFNHLTWTGVGQSALILVTVWWAWNYTTWMTNWFDPEAIPVRLVLVTVMLMGLLMAIVITGAFTTTPLLFVLPYVAQQVIRNAFNLVAVAKGTTWRDSFLRILVWSIAAGCIWIAGVFVDDSLRAWVWTCALVVELAAPAVRYWIPLRGASAYSSWEIDAHHFAERFQLLVIIALGEGIVVIGSAVAATETTGPVVATMIVGFLITTCMWWMYFDIVAERAQMNLHRASESGQLARDGFTYLHLPIITGIIVFAVALKLVLKHPLDPLEHRAIAATLAGPLIYLVGHNLFRLRMTGTWSRYRLVAAIAIVLLAPVGPHVAAAVLAGLMLAVLVILVAVESVSARRWFASLPPADRPQSLRHLERWDAAG